MPQKTDLNVSPYHDDFDSKSNFYKVLFRSGYSIQGRELTTLQSILQNQLESIGKNLFKQGDMIVPGEIRLNTRLNYVKLSSVSEIAVNVNGDIVFQKYDIKNLIGLSLTGLTSGVIGVVIAAEYSNETESDILFVKYVNSGNSSDERTFRQGETLEADIENSPTLVVGTDGSVFPTTITRVDGDTKKVLPSIGSPAMSYGSAVRVEEGIYFVNGFFVRNPEQLIILDKYYDKPSCKVGFTVSEELVTPEEDNTLYDNARGFSNFSAPGAHRLKINLKLTVYDYDAQTDDNFIKLIDIKNGVVEKILKPVDYNLIEETLARRTYDESGDYVVDNFAVELREYYQKNNNKGIYPLSEDGTVNGLTPTEASRKMLIGVGPGKAYVKGYEIVNKETKYYPIDKARDLIEKKDNRIKIKNLPYFNITNVYGTIPLNSEGTSLTAYPTLFLNSVFTDGSLGFNNTENTDEETYTQTLDRRSKINSGASSSYGLNDGIKTIYIELRSGESFPTSLIFGKTPSSPVNNGIDGFDKLYYIKTRGVSTLISSVELLAYKKVKRTDISQVQTYLELTVRGNKFDLMELFLDYDAGDTGSQGLKRRKLFLSQSDALSDSTAYYGYIIDYNETFTPVIGLAKPKNITFLKEGAGFNYDTDKVLSKGSLASGVKPYNGIFSLSYFNPSFFTRITLDTKVTTGFTSGQYITGYKSGAFGVIENSSAGFYTPYGSNVLFVKTISGTFLPGETITDENGNSLRIAKENTISHFVVINRGAGYNPTTTTISVNNIKLDTSIVSTYIDTAIAPGGTGSLNGVYSIEIKDRNLFQTEYFYPPEVNAVSTTSSPSTGSGAVIVPVMFRNTVIDYNNQDVKSISSTFNSYNFTSDIEYSANGFYSTKNVTNFSFVGLAGRKYLECIGFAGDATLDLKSGDIIQFTDSNNNVIRSIVQYATKPEGLLKSRIYLNTSLKNSVDGAVVKIFTKLENSESNLLIPTGSKYVQALVKDPSNSNIKYNIRRDFVITTSNSGGSVITFVAQLPLGTQRFVPFSKENFVVSVLSNANSTEINNGDILSIKSEWVSITNTTETSGLSSGTFNLNIPSTFFAVPNNSLPNLKLKLTATVEVDKSIPRIKTLIKNRKILISSSSDKSIILRGQEYNSENQQITSYSDVIKINYVYEGSITTPPVVDDAGNLITGSDITERFSFDDGQRDTFYDVSRLILKPGFASPKGILLISFDYFEHSQGDFCTVDSYLHESGVTVDEIPFFNSASLGKISLRDVIDFRPKVDTTSVVSGYQNNSILALEDYCSFIGSGGVITNTPAPDASLEYTIKFDLSQYLDRIDSLILNKKGEFAINPGNPSLNPVKPEEIKDGITLYNMFIPAYTDSVDDVKTFPVDNRRYTMRDIGKLEKRIERLEYYTQLSILEQQALNMQIKDEIGLDRFKSGFIVDGFENHSIGNLNSIDYRCAIDSQQSILRPQSSESSYDLEEVYKTDNLRTASGYKYSNGIVTLPYSNLILVQNQFATRTINPTAFDISRGQYVGDAYLSPSVDQWYDDKERPIILNNDSSLYSIFFAKSVARESFNSIHNSYLINWIGTNRTFFNTNSLSNLSTVTSSATIRNASISSSSNISPQNNESARGASSTTIGSNNVVTSLNFYARTKIVEFKLNRMKPNTRLYVFVDGRNIDRWVLPDIRYTGIPGNSLSTFGSPITTDSDGNASGFILIPSGHPPVISSSWLGDIQSISYDTSYEQFNLTTGTKTVRFSSSSTDSKGSSTSTFSETKYYCTGILPPLPSSIVSTTPPLFKAEEGIQFVESSPTSPSPLTQTFRVENAEGGLFTTGVDLFFNQKSSNLPLRVYLTDVVSGKPGKYVIPGTEILKLPNTYLKVFTNGSISLKIGENITGASSGAVGPLSSVKDRNDVLLNPSTDGTVVLESGQIYTLILSNHNGVSFRSNETLSIPSVILFNNTQTSGSNPRIVTIAKDSGRVSKLKLKSFGQNYETANIVIESPSIPGGVSATGNVLVSNGKIYDVELSLFGSGYTEIPSVIIRGTGVGASGAEIEAEISIDTPAVVMGVAVDSELFGLSASTIPTRFNFDYPVYLQNDTEYALVIETDSNQYRLWSSSLGERDNVLNTIATTQPSLGSVYKSQNVDNWTEDLSEDIKFTLYKASFDTSATASVYLTPKDLGYELLNINPFETDSSQDSTSSSLLFRNNNKIIKVYHPSNGFESSGKSLVNFKRSESVSGISTDILNGTLFEVSNGGNEYYTIDSGYRAGSTVKGGGNKVLASYNRKYEKLYPQISLINFSSTNIVSYVKTTDIIPFDNNSTVYSSYNQNSEYERTFLNEEQFFTNQKVICSRINEINNGIDNSLVYKIDLSSSNTNLSPILDLRFASVKSVNNLVEKSTGKEDRFGRRNQIIKFYPVYKFQVNGLSGYVPAINQTVSGSQSKASGVIVKWDSNGGIMYVKVKTDNVFQAGDVLTYSNSGTPTNSSISSNGVQIYSPNFTVNTIVSALSASNVAYTDIISGNIISWDAQTKTLIVSNNKKPINNNYTSNTSVTPYSRVNSGQVTDIFRVGDRLTYQGIVSGEESFVEISSINYTDGVEYVSETFSSNSSSIAKYVTKEIVLQNSSTCIDVRLTQNLFSSDDVLVFYKIKLSNSQINFDDLNWYAFNDNGESDTEIVPSAENSVSGLYENQESYKEYKYSISGLPEFTSYAIKIVMRSSNPAFIPKIQDMRAVASF